MGDTLPDVAQELAGFGIEVDFGGTNPIGEDGSDVERGTIKPHPPEGLASLVSVAIAKAIDDTFTDCFAGDRVERLQGVLDSRQDVLALVSSGYAELFFRRWFTAHAESDEAQRLREDYGMAVSRILQESRKPCSGFNHLRWTLPVFFRGARLSFGHGDYWNITQLRGMRTGRERNGGVPSARLLSVDADSHAGCLLGPPVPLTKRGRWFVSDNEPLRVAFPVWNGKIELLVVMHGNELHTYQPQEEAFARATDAEVLDLLSAECAQD